MQTILELEFPFGVADPELYCPACGQIVLSLDEPVDERCQHVKFVYISEIDDFDLIDEALEAAVEAAGAEVDDDDDEPSKLDLVRAVYPKSTTAFVVSITTGGMACGPSWSTVTVGFDLALPVSAASPT